MPAEGHSSLANSTLRRPDTIGKEGNPMKKLICVLLIALLACLPALAAEETPKDFMTSRGMTILDETQLENFWDPHPDFTLCSFNTSYYGSGAILWFDGDMVYTAFDMMSLVNKSNAPTPMYKLFQEFVEKYPDFEVFQCFTIDDSIVYTRDEAMLQKVVERDEHPLLASYTDFDEFMDAAWELVKP